MKNLLFLTFFLGYHHFCTSHHCERPHLSRHKAYVYSSIGKVPVKVNRCLFNDTISAYSDISNNCLIAFKSGVFEDKWTDKNPLEEKQSPVVLEEYVTKADLVKNEIYLRSGTICRYDRGFCYDPKETRNYAVVWETVEKLNIQCPDKLHTVFEGEVDFWYFKEQDLKYLFYYEENEDEAFYLSLMEKDSCQGNEVWHTQEGYIVALKALNARPSSGKYFSTKSKKVISEDILKNCDLRSIPLKELNDHRIDLEYLRDPYNLYLLFKRYQEIIKESENHIKDIINNSFITNNAEIQNQINDLKNLLSKVKKDVANIEISIKNHNSGSSILNELKLQIKELLDKNEEFEEIHAVLMQSNKKLTQQLNARNLDLDKLIYKVDLLQTVINSHIPEFIKKSEVIEKMTDLRIDFEQKIKEMSANLSKVLANIDNKSVKGGSKLTASQYELEEIILEKLKSYNKDQCDAAVNGLDEKLLLVIEQLRTESFVNVTNLDEKFTQKYLDVEAKFEPIENSIKKAESQLDKFYEKVEVNTKSFDKIDTLINDFGTVNVKIIDLIKKDAEFDDLIKEIKSAISDNKRVDKNVIDDGKVKEWVKDLFILRDERLDSLETTTVLLNNDIKNNTADIIILKQKIYEIMKSVIKIDTIKSEIINEFNTDLVINFKDNITTKYDYLLNELNNHSEEINKIYNENNKSFQNIVNLLENVDAIKDKAVKDSARISALEDAESKQKNTLELIQNQITKQETNIIEFNKKIDIKCDLTVDKTNDKINDLYNNVTLLYEIAKNQGNLLYLLKKAVKIDESQMEQQQEEDLGGHFGTQIGGFKGGIKVNIKHPNNGWMHWNKWDKKHHHDKFENHQQFEQKIITHQQQQQQQHIQHEFSDFTDVNELKESLVEAKLIIKQQGDKIKRLEDKIEQLLDKFERHEKYVKIIDQKTVTNHGDFTALESEVKSRLSKCCGGTKGFKMFGHK